MGSVHQLWEFRNVSLELLVLLRVKTRRFWPSNVNFAKKKWANTIDYPRVYWGETGAVPSRDIIWLLDMMNPMLSYIIMMYVILLLTNVIKYPPISVT